MQVFDITLPSNGSAFVVHAAGRYIKYLSGNAGGNDASIIITPGAAGGSKIFLTPGQAYRVADDGAVPDSWTLANNLGQATITGKVVVGNGKIDDNSLQGVVQVVDGGKARTLANAAFTGNGVQAAVASQFSRVQLWNPANSGMRAVVESVSIHVPAGLTAALYYVTAAITTLEEVGQSKLAGGAPAKCSIYIDSNASAPAFPLLMQIAAPANSTTMFQPKEPFVLPPGYGLEIYSSTLNAMLGGNFEWYEEPNV
ncbi:hypothetical protein [Burkholderia ubonensis]|uniref:hypothetical protein n=1 Tax=Burkholderia ubonensis TaxID=101571 RepID=UPI0008FE7505|nr:hypothetical protein [Burkholderia ubonensis]OJB11572.1 hypothetical protein BGV48_12950 [Burkholderia ubonensis]